MFTVTSGQRVAYALSFAACAAWDRRHCETKDLAMAIPTLFDLKRNSQMGRFSVAFEVCNYRDLVAAQLGVLPPEKVRRAVITGVVDTGASRLVLPGSIVTELGFRTAGTIMVRFADGRRDEKNIVTDVQVQIQDRSSVFKAVVEPGRSDALIGAIVLEELDLIPDCTAQKLVPRDPHGMFAELD
jgi:aspartyl protease